MKNSDFGKFSFLACQRSPAYYRPRMLPYGSCKNRRLGRTYRLHRQSDKNRRARKNDSSVLRLLVTANVEEWRLLGCYAILHSHRRENFKSYTANVVPSSPIYVNLMIKAICSYETSILTKAVRCNPRRRHSSQSPSDRHLST
jgi:hypothetical protein